MIQKFLTQSNPWPTANPPTTTKSLPQPDDWVSQLERLVELAERIGWAGWGKLLAALSMREDPEAPRRR
ncbi:uncharacterized protein N7515_007528 [Penicillium bovifimosum]|uniref:Uncharacterized protein n=1 Tax=Penicillium bovifimosum TaxID=126998 RepID=A0A9W9GWT4_9EURO|nr:uncharacterized protein N7515_007528 [Penicillium bovifimosum]KAJ5131489.1 hypothetical protein N7515_007528 [Penicillium bovifimosum]